MEKRRFKLNILDFVIFVVILCSVAVLVFRDTVNEIFTEPEMTTLEVCFFVDGAEEIGLIRSSVGKDAVLVLDEKEGLHVAASISKIQIALGSLTVPQKGDVTVSISGYKRLGRYYTENGERIYVDTECVFVIGENQVEGKVISVGIGG